MGPCVGSEGAEGRGDRGRRFLPYMFRGANSSIDHASLQLRVKSRTKLWLPHCTAFQGRCDVALPSLTSPSAAPLRSSVRALHTHTHIIAYSFVLTKASPNLHTFKFCSYLLGLVDASCLDFYYMNSARHNIGCLGRYNGGRTDSAFIYKPS